MLRILRKMNKLEQFSSFIMKKNQECVIFFSMKKKYYKKKLGTYRVLVLGDGVVIV